MVCSFLNGSRTAKFNYGYSSFKGKRASMEDFYETRISEVDGQMVAFFGVFDGICLSFSFPSIQIVFFLSFSIHQIKSNSCVFN